MSLLLQMTGPVMDLTYNVRAIPASGAEAEVTGFAMVVGGGFNAMAAAHAAGMAVRLGGSIGTGPLAGIVAERLKELGIDCARPAVAGHDQGCCTVLLEPDGERSFVGYPGAEGQITASDLAKIELSDVTHVMLSGYTLYYPAARVALADWVAGLQADITVIFDPSPVVALLSEVILRKVMSRADWVSANAAEAVVLTGKSDPVEAASALAHDRQGAVLRSGAAGCVLATGGQVHRIDPHRVEAIDTNGAGDCHIGCFIAELARSGDALRAARYANIAAALSTTRAGSATPPEHRQVLALI